MTADKFGGLPYLSALWNHGWAGALFIMWVVDLGLVYFFELLEGVPPWKRPYYHAQLWGDLIFLPLYFACATLIFERAPPMSGFYTARWWHYSILALGIALSIIMEVGAVKGGQYTLSQELSPSKLWHTIIFPVVFYWIFSALVPVLVNFWVVPAASAGIVVAATGFYIMNWLDWQDLTSKTNVHLEGTYIPWEWHFRKK